ncbi:MAG: hypothetical protein JRI37_07570 [Deltaproteobacteria bacterium]|nr:hypothetical protein [Deltaproteobacteria bacterium]
MFYKRDTKGYREVLPGIKLKTLVYGQKGAFAKVSLDGNYLRRINVPHSS